MNKFKNKIALITGSSRAMGKSIALKLAKEGAFVIIHYTNNISPAQQTLNEVNATGGQGALVKVNFSDSNSIDDLFSQVVKILSEKKIDFLINNAGVFKKGNIETASEEQFAKMFNVNVKSVFYRSTFYLNYG